MKWKFGELRGRVQAATGKIVTYEEINDATGLANQTISSIGTGKAKRLDLHTIEKLLAFFSARLGEQLSTNDLLEWRPDSESGEPQ